MKMTRIFDDINYELTSRIGQNVSKTNDLDSSTFDLIRNVVIFELFPKLREDLKNFSEQEALNRFKNEYIGKFMSLYHNTVVKHEKFHWNWD